MSKKNRWIPGILALIIVVAMVVGAIHFLRQQGNLEQLGNLTQGQQGYKNLTINDVNVCQIDADCVMAGEGVCGSPASIHIDQQSIWEQHQDWLIKKEGLVVCEPSLPLESFKPRCVNTRCKAVMLQNHAVLEFEEAPLLSLATKLRFSFQFSEDKQDVEAVIHLAEGIELIEGELFWQGNLPQSVEKTLEITIKVNETGHFRIQGTVDFSNGFPINVQDTVDIEVTSQGTFMETRPVNYWEQTIGYALPANQDQLSSELVIEPKPALDETFTLIYRVKPLLEVFPQNMQANLVLPEHAFEVLAAQFPQEGESQQSGMQFIWTGSPHEGETIEIQLTLKAITTGWGPIFATSFVSEGGAIQQGITDTLLADLYVGEYAGGYTIGEP